MDDAVRETYFHIAPSIETRVLQHLQDRWEKTAADLDTTWRDAA